MSGDRLYDPDRLYGPTNAADDARVGSDELALDAAIRAQSATESAAARESEQKARANDERLTRLRKNLEKFVSVMTAPDVTDPRTDTKVRKDDFDPFPLGS